NLYAEIINNEICLNTDGVLFNEYSETTSSSGINTRKFEYVLTKDFISNDEKDLLLNINSNPTATTCEFIDLRLGDFKFLSNTATFSGAGKNFQSTSYMYKSTEANNKYYEYLVWVTIGLPEIDSKGYSFSFKFLIQRLEEGYHSSGSYTQLSSSDFENIKNYLTNDQTSENLNFSCYFRLVLDN
ncbi:MAG: hypothetical protein ACI4TI_02395, partial [Christensenellales bacterium]